MHHPWCGEANLIYTWCMKFDAEDLRRFAGRDWEAPARLARQARACAPIAEKVRIAVELYEAAKAMRPDWPDEASRRRDIEAHIRLHQLMVRAGNVRPR